MIELERIGWENYPSTKTPRNAENLNKMEENTQKAITELENDALKMEENTQKAINKLEEKVLGTILYENSDGTNEDITLSETVENYDCIEIFYRNNTGVGMYNSIKIENANNKMAILSTPFINQAGLMLNVATAVKTIL